MENRISRLSSMLGASLVLLMTAALTTMAAGCGGSSGGSSPKASATADTIFKNGVIQTIDPAMSTAQAVAVGGGKILAVGTNKQVARFQGSSTKVVDLQGEALLPGFIDTHSHMMGWGAGYTNIVLAQNWVDISSQNMFFKPSPGDPRCANPNDYETCFIPVQTQDDVIARLQAAVAAAPAPGASPPAPIVGFNYDPSRLGHSAGCPGTGVGFSCPNFEDGHALTDLDALSTTIPIYIVSESGHIVYTNTPALKEQNICLPNGPQTGCTVPSINPLQEEQMATFGQLNEDLALAAESNLAAGNGSNPLQFVQILTTAANAYAQHGYTTIQEGAATPVQTAIYALATQDPSFPVTAAVLIYDPTVPAAEIQKEIDQATVLKQVTALNPNLLVAGPKVFADGSVQGLTAFISGTGYLPAVTDNTLYAPAYGIWTPPYVGAADFTESDIASAAALAHQAGFPLFIHQNGTGAIQNALDAIQAAGTVSGLRDLMIHFSMPTPAEIAQAKQLGVDVTFLMENLYYLGLPLCQQLLGPDKTAGLYPAASAIGAGLHVSLHPDTTVTAPYPLFAIWVANTRTTQQPTWYPNLGTATCPVVQGPTEVISIAQGIKAYTIEAAYEYGLDNQLGSIEVGKKADFVILSADPLSMENTPDNLSTIRTIATVHNGTYFANPNADQTPIWPN